MVEKSGWNFLTRMAELVSRISHTRKSAKRLQRMQDEAAPDSNVMSECEAIGTMA